MLARVFIASLAICGAMASTVPSFMGVEVVRKDGMTLVREVPRSLSERSCTNCVHVGGACTIGEGQCYGTENALCTDCGGGRIICVDQAHGSCSAP